MNRSKRNQRNKKGTVAVILRGEMLNLRWSYGGKRYRLPLGMANTPLNRHLAQGKASEIQSDLAYGRFDESLDKYREQCDESSSMSSTVDLFQKFMEYRQQEGTSGQAIASRYKPILSNLKRFGKLIDDTAKAREFIDLLRSRQAPLTSNQNLSLLKGFGKWCVTSAFWTENYFVPIKRLKGGRKGQSRKPFTREEITRLLEAIQTDPVYCYYHDFCYTLFSLGLRPSEAIGLRWKHVDLARAEVTICESLSRSADGKAAGYARQRKTTKTGNSRVLPLNQRLVTMFSERSSVDVQGDDLVFPSRKGKPIDDHSFSQRVWKRMCAKAGIDYRPPYTARHTLLSHGLESEGWTPHQAAQIAGHSSTRTVMEHYAHVINRPKLPEF